MLLGVYFLETLDMHKKTLQHAGQGQFFRTLEQRFVCTFFEAAAEHSHFSRQLQNGLASFCHSACALEPKSPVLLQQVEEHCGGVPQRAAESWRLKSQIQRE